MKTFGGKQRLCVSGWLMAALIIAAINGHAFMTLESTPLEGSSIVIKSLRAKIARLDGVLSGNRFNLFEQAGDKEWVSSLRIPQPNEHAAEAEMPLHGVETIALPVLSGIVRVAHSTRAPYYMAVLDGHVCRERERVKEFVVGKISAQGVLLLREGEQWYIESSAPYYSSDQGK
jgi:hypothetical protein